MLRIVDERLKKVKLATLKMGDFFIYQNRLFEVVKNYKTQEFGYLLLDVGNIIDVNNDIFEQDLQTLVSPIKNVVVTFE